MRITVADDDPQVRQMPNGIFLARRGGPGGPLTIIAPSCGMVGSFNAMDLEGRGGPAIGDTWGTLSRDYVVKNFTPVDSSITFRNEYS